MADAAVTTQFGLACTVLVADCLPVLLTDQNGRAVAAAHAGWRGLAAGILENTVRALCRAADCTAAQVLAWLGPCIGPEAFEVGPDVLQAFGVATDGGEANSSIMGTRSKSGVGGLNLTTETAKAFSYAPRPDGTPRWRADLAQLACQRLGSVGVHRVTASGLCTAGDASRFFSFRRDGLTGRMAASIWRRA
jgi:YfiH family protein